MTVSFRAVPHFVSEAIGALTGIDAKPDDAWHSRLLLCALHSFLLLAGQPDCYHCGCGFIAWQWCQPSERVRLLCVRLRQACDRVPRRRWHG